VEDVVLVGLGLVLVGLGLVLVGLGLVLVVDGLLQEARLVELGIVLRFFQGEVGLSTAEIGVFGGSGFYSFLDDVREVEVDTPYGPPSSPLLVGEIEGRTVAFIPRHGTKHQLPPHRINYRANLWAMKEA